jgi:thiamine pyrophosphate-dependent acetolactate synthase large subunit-like protein
MRNYVDGGEAIVEALRKLRVDYIMSSPGSEWSPVWEALTRQKTEKRAGPTFIESWHETLAVNMAQAYTLMTGRPQAVMLHAGVGLLQGAMGVHGAMQAEVPMIVMSGESQSLGSDPNLDIEGQWYAGLSTGGNERFLEPVTKWGKTVTSPYTLYDMVVRAGEMAQRSPMGPIYLNVPLEHMLHEWSPPDSATREVPPAPKMQAAPEEIEKIAALIRSANRPVVVTEASGRDPAAFEALVEFADALAIPVILGRNATLANFPTDHPLYLGAMTYQYVKDADLVLMVGCRAPWYPPHKRPTSGKIVLIHDNAFKNYMVHQIQHTDAYLEGDIALSLRLLTKALADGVNPKLVKERREHWKREHDKVMAALQAEQKKAADAKGIDPITVVATLGEVMPRDTIFVDETITAQFIVREHLPIHGPQSFFRGYGGLGQGIGLALGFKLAAPKRPVVLILGDGTFLYNPIVQALGASKQHDLPITIVVLNNKMYRAMMMGHIHHYPDGAAANDDYSYGVKINGPRYDELGKPFDFHGQRVEKAADLAAALKSALAANKKGKTAILDVMVTR